MRSDSVRIIRNTVFLYIRMSFLMFVSFFTSRIVLQNLGVTDFGIYNIVGGLASMFVFFRSSLSNATQRYLSIELGKNNVSGAATIFRQHRMLYIIITITVLSLSETVGLWFVRNKLVIPPERMDAAIWVYQFTVLSCCMVLLSVVYDATIIAHEDMGVYSYIGMFEGVAKLAIAYIITVVSSDKLVIYAFLLFLLSSLARIFYAYFCRKKYPECKYAFTWDIKGLKEPFSFIGWNTVGTFIQTLNDQGVNILLNLSFGPAVNAARGISYQINGAVCNFSTNFYTAVRPQIMKSYATGDKPYMLGLFFSSSRYSVFLLWFLCLPLLLCINPILDVWLTNVPPYTAVFTVWILAYSMVNVLNYPIWTVALAVNCLKSYILVGSCVFLTAFPISYVCLEAGCHPVAVFQVLLVVRIIYIGVILQVIRRYVYFPLRDYLALVIKPVVIVIAGSGSVCLPLSRLLFGQTLGGCLLTGVTCVLSVSVLLWMFGMTDGERGVVAKKIKFFMSKSGKE